MRNNLLDMKLNKKKVVLIFFEFLNFSSFKYFQYIGNKNG